MASQTAGTVYRSYGVRRETGFLKAADYGRTATISILTRENIDRAGNLSCGVITWMGRYVGNCGPPFRLSARSTREPVNAGSTSGSAKAVEV